MTHENLNGTNNESLINLDYLEQLSDGDIDWSIEMMNMFIENTPDSIQDMRNQYNEKNWPTLRRVAHTLKSQLNMLGIKSLSGIILTIEKSAEKETDLDQIPELIEKTHDVCTKAIEELNAVIKKLKSQK